MDWKIFAATFVSIFVAELADKTQLVGVCMSAKTQKFFSVWLGSMLGYMLVTTISVIIGCMLGKCIEVRIVKYIGATLFIILGVLMYFDIV